MFRIELKLLGVVKELTVIELKISYMYLFDMIVSFILRKIELDENY